VDSEGGLVFKDRQLVPRPRSLIIVQFGESEYNLIHLDKDGSEIADSFHETLKDALKQASLEFMIEPNDWSVVAEKYV